MLHVAQSRISYAFYSSSHVRCCPPSVILCEMKYFERTELSSSRRPVLLPNESLIIQQGNVGLYERKNKIDDYQDGVCYLTSHRIIYVDNARPAEKAVELSLGDIKEADSYGGFLRASPKIILHLEKKTVSSPSRRSMPQMTLPTWVCPICSFANAGTLEKCQLCGVKRAEEAITPTTPTMPTPPTDPPPSSNNGDVSCRACTFINHPSMMQCEMCGTDLATVPLPSPTVSTPSSISESVATVQLEDNAHVRLAFRHGGQSGFLGKLKSALEAKAWDKPIESPVERTSISKSRGAGISAIQDRIEKNTAEASETMTDAFQDLDRLMGKATEMVKLAESISQKMNRDTNNTEGDLSTLRTYLLELGISDPVTRGSAGSIYHQELARELGEFLSKIFNEQDSMKSLTDLYCIFNRARGVALISPEDIYKAAQQFEELKLPFRLRKFPSGLLVVQTQYMDDDRAARRILQHVKQQGGHITALRLAEMENFALALATEQLLITEQKGLICRDESPTGLTFYENVFLL
ncbi:EAP30/Vps36 family-domain-containing protein [Zychaea mexicana]|uniref:EAP30/Vps36 family-domain-containing protein n=1 Tax=Zychaea mexicana TaxID=64656 RepID=UPI0022FE0C92|nr:EAP30/Vps36 family-domain-containing protein [Zychaea mexicana]KAI9497957.1 EAP30/Vps36 family-domain-containing protein [Zychaea mexicana]